MAFSHARARTFACGVQTFSLASIRIVGFNKVTGFHSTPDKVPLPNPSLYPYCGTSCIRPSPLHSCQVGSCGHCRCGGIAHMGCGTYLRALCCQLRLWYCCGMELASSTCPVHKNERSAKRWKKTNNNKSNKTARKQQCSREKCPESTYSSEMKSYTW